MPISTSTGLYYRVDGPMGAPSLVLLHGGPGAHHDYLYPQMLELARDHRVFAYDQRGGGQSRTDDPAPITWHTHVTDLGALLREWGMSSPTIIGYSWGGLLAMLYAIESARQSSSTPVPNDKSVTDSDGHLCTPLPPPARMILISPAPVTREWRSRFEANLAERSRSAEVERMREELAASGLRENDPAAYRQRSFELAVAGYFANPRNAVALTPFRVTGKVQQSVWSSLGEYDLRNSLCAVTCPVLVVHGDSDPIPLESARVAVASMSGASDGGQRVRLVVLKDCGHVPYVEAPVGLFNAIREFLASTDSA